jgi:hypothetical protein
MSNEIVPQTTDKARNALAEIAPNKYATEAAFGAVSSASGFLPRIQLMQATSELVKLDKMKQSAYALVRSADSFEDLTKEVNLIPIAWRPKALDTSDRKKIISAYNPKSVEFKKIAAKSEIANSGAMYGPEFLCWVPSLGIWATFFMSSKTARRAADDFMQRLEKKKSLTLKSTLIKGQQNSWWGPVITDCSAPLQSWTDLGEAKNVLEKFNNTPDIETEDGGQEAPAGAGDRVR